jgi:lipopolysaccharide export LptBFGC system permease protein LptF
LRVKLSITHPVFGDTSPKALERSTTLPVALFTDIAYAALTLLIAVLAVYFALRLLGKLTKFVVTVIVVVVVVVVLWMIFSDHSIIQSASDLLLHFH